MPRSPDDTTLRRLLARIRGRSAVISVVGLGYVGLPLALRFAEAGFKVIGVDIDPRKISSLSVSKSYIGYIPDQEVARARDSGFLATTDFAALKDADAVIICVPTPLSRNREPDLSYVFSTLDSLVPFLSAGKVVSLESTTWPGTTEEEVLPRLSAGGLRVGQDFFLVFSPERADPANASHSTGSIPKICAGVTPSCLEAGTALYGSAIDTIVPMSSPRAAEMTKLLENIHRSVNIGLVNEMKIVSDRMGIDIFEVIRAAATKPFGFTPYFPGPGVGGHCIPVDPFYLTWKAREFGVHTRFIELAGEVNQGMPHWVVDKIASALNDRGKPLHGSRVLILGIAYKKNVEDMRESPSVEILSLLAAKGARVSYSDPHVPSFPEMRRHSFDLKSLELDPGVVAGFDCVVLATDHDGFDYDMIRENAALIIDTRGRFPVGDPRVVRA